MKKVILSLCLFGAAILCARAQSPSGVPGSEPKAPELEYVVRLHVTLGQAFSVGDTGKGTRTVIPITGGTFEGPDLKGEVLPGGADYQMQCDGRTEIEAIYCIRTEDGVSRVNSGEISLKLS